MKTLDMGLWNGSKYTSNLWKIQRWTLLLLMLAGFWTSATQANVSITSITQDPVNNVSMDVPITYRVTVSYPAGVNSGESIEINIYDNDTNVTSRFTPENTLSCVQEGNIWCDSSYPDANSDTFIITWAFPTSGTYNLVFSVSCVYTPECSGDSQLVTTIVGNINPRGFTPVANAGSDQTVTDTNNDGSQSVTLDGSGSSDADNDITSYEWFEDGQSLGTDVKLTTNLTVGSHTLTLKVWDSMENMSTDDVTITVQKPASSNNQATIETVSGDNQRLSEGDSSDPLSIRAIGVDGQPLAGVTITWIVIPADAAILSSDTTTTNSNGESSNTVSLTAERTASTFQVTASILEGASARFQINPLAGISGLTAAQRSVANALDNACPALQSEDRSFTIQEQSLLATCDYLATASDQEIISALQQFIPDEIAAQGRNSISLARIRNKNILLRLNDLRRGVTGPSVENIAVSIQGEQLPSILIRELTKSPRGGGASAESSELASRLGVFVNGNISFGDTETTENAAGFDFETNGLTLGIDYRFSDQFVLGGAFNYISTNSDYISKSSTLDIDGYSMSLYGSYYQSEQVFVDSILSIGLNNYDSRREFTTGGINHHFNGDTDGTEYALSLGGGYEINYQNLSFVPQARINYLRVKVDSYDETSSGSGLNLNIGDQDIESLITSVSGNMSLAYSTQYGVFIPYLSIEWEHEFQNDSRAIIARFVNDPSRTNFSVLTDDPDQDYFYVGLGLTAALAKGRSAFLYYEKLLAHSDTSQYTITGGFRLEF